MQVPPELLKKLGIRAGQYVWIGENPDRPGTLVVVNDRQMKDIVRKGWIAAG